MPEVTLTEDEIAKRWLEANHLCAVAWEVVTKMVEACPTGTVVWVPDQNTYRLPSEKAIGLPKYQSHKQVRALPIAAVGSSGNIEKPGRWLNFNGPYAPIYAPEEMFARYQPQPGDYYVVYEDGYESFSPKKSFEEGYTRL